MCVYVLTKLQVSIIIVTSFRQGVVFETGKGAQGKRRDLQRKQTDVLESFRRLSKNR